METYALLFAATLNAGTVLAIAALGLLINERAGIVNLGAEGIMLCAAIAGFATVVHTGSDWLGFAAGMAAGALLAALLGWLVIWLNTNQYATGLALSLFGVGFSAFAGIGYVQAKPPGWPALVTGARLKTMHKNGHLRRYLVKVSYKNRSSQPCVTAAACPSRTPPGAGMAACHMNWTKPSPKACARTARP